jgi:hypothetical protein
MAKLALALAAIVLLALSTGLTDPRIGQTPFEQASIATLSPGNRPGVMGGEMAVFPAAGSGADPGLTQRAELKAPPLALVVYLVVVLIGSALAIGVMRQRQLR